MSFKLFQQIVVGISIEGHDSHGQLCQRDSISPLMGCSAEEDAIR